MKFSRKWLEEYIDVVKFRDKELAEGLTKSGIEVEAVSKLVNSSGIIVAMITNVKPHPDSDKLSICSLDVGKSEEIEVVCGASNVRGYMKVAYAPVGSKVNGIEITEATIRGVVSPGMICSMEEIGIGSEFVQESQREGIATLANSAQIGTDVIELLELDDTIFELGLTPNRSDCLSIIGIAYEISAIFDIPLKKRTIKYPEVENSTDLLKLLVSNSDVNYFSLMPLHNIKVIESPQFIKSRLIACGIRPINNIVDITNYILLETGQPLHAFDLAKSTVDFEIRSAFNGEKTKLLDESEIVLDPSDIVVANQESALSLAGVMGGYSSRVTKYTENIVLECANFNSETIRQTAKRHALRSDSSVRFEKGVDVNRTELAMKMAVELLVKYADAKLSTNPVVYKKENFKFDDSDIVLEYDKLVKYMGFKIDVKEVAKILDRLQLKYTFEDSKFTVKRISRRPDLEFDVCIIEEIVRLYGVDNIKGELPIIRLKRSHVGQNTHNLGLIKNLLHSMGYSEAINYSLTSKEKASIGLETNEELVKIKNPLSSEREYMRKSLIPSLIDTASYNLERQISIVRLYEISQVSFLIDGEYTTHNRLSAIISGFKHDNPLFDMSIQGDFYLIKGSIQKLLSMASLIEGQDYSIEQAADIPKIFHPYQSAEIKFGDKVVGYVGKIHPKHSKHDLYAFEIDFYELRKIFKDDINVEQISIYPSVTRDISIVVSDDIRSIDMVNSIRGLNLDLLEDINVFNVYKDESLKGNKSITFKMKFGSTTKTLSEEEISEKVNIIIDCFRGQYNGELR